MKKPIPFGKYYLLERINVGGMAEVFRAKAFGVEGFERLVAVKRILPNIAEDKEFIRMFIDEAKIAVQLNHANIAQIFDLGVQDKSYYIALEHVHGRDLRAIFDRCRQQGGGTGGEAGEPMPIAQACFVMMKVCEGLDYAHNKRDQAGRELNLVHRDVSPQNVLVSFEGEVKIIDFGIAKAAGKGSKTQAGILKGKFGYMSPEQVRGLPIDRRSDIFACGIVLYELLTGERLFVGESDFNTLEKVRNVEILPPSTYNRKIPDELERIVLKALAKDVEDRYQNAIDLHDELQAFVYTAGEFYSRKDLAAWMKPTFAREIEEETAKLESYRQISAPPVQPTPNPSSAKPRKGPPAAPPGRRQTSGAGPGKPPPPPRNGRRVDPRDDKPTIPVTDAMAAGGLEWDEEELETSIYADKDELETPAARGPSGQLAAVRARTLPPSPPPGGQGASSRGPNKRVSNGHAAQAALAAGSGTAEALDGDDTIEDPRPVGARRSVARPVVSDPTAVAELARLAEQQKAGGPIHDTAAAVAAVAAASGKRSTTASAVAAAPTTSSFGSSYLAKHEKNSLLTATVAKVAAAAALGVVIALVLYVLAGGDDKTAGEATAATETPAATAAAAAGATAAGAVPTVAAVDPAANVDPNTGFDLIVEPAGVKVKLDGRPIGKAPLQIRNLTDGKHTVELEAAPGFFGKSETVEVTRGQAERVVIRLDPMDVVAKLTSDPSGATVSLMVDGDKQEVGTTPVDVKLDPRKSYEAVFRKDGYDTQTRAITMTGGQEVPVAVTLVRGSSDSSVGKVASSSGSRSSSGRRGSSSRVDRISDDEATDELIASSGRPVEKLSKPVLDTGAVAEPVDKPEPPVAKPEPVKEEMGTLGLMSKPPCKIFIDGRDTGEKTPQVGIKLKAGSHRITLVNNEFGIKESFSVKIKGGEATKVLKDLTDRLPQ